MTAAMLAQKHTHQTIYKHKNFIVCKRSSRAVAREMLESHGAGLRDGMPVRMIMRRWLHEIFWPLFDLYTITQRQWDEERRVAHLQRLFAVGGGICASLDWRYVWIGGISVRIVAQHSARL